MKKHFPSTKARKTLLAAAGALLLCTSPAVSDANSAVIDGHYTTASLSAQEQKAGNLLNSDRAAYGLPPLAIDPALSRIARIKSEDMRDNQYFSHTSPAYGDIADMLRRFGVQFTAAGENIAHHATIEKSQAALISSPGHRRNILSAGYTKAGVGVAIDESGFVYLTQIFVR